MLLINLDYIYDTLNGNDIVKDIKLYSLYDSIYELNNILEVYAKFKNTKVLKEYKKYIEKTFTGIKCFTMNNKVFISNNRTKSDAIEFIRKLNNININDVYAVGDGINDIEMLEQFNGYKMPFSCCKLFFKNIPTTRNVKSLVKKINRG